MQLALFFALHGFFGVSPPPTLWPLQMSPAHLQIGVKKAKAAGAKNSKKINKAPQLRNAKSETHWPGHVHPADQRDDVEREVEVQVEYRHPEAPSPQPGLIVLLPLEGRPPHSHHTRRAHPQEHT